MAGTTLSFSDHERRIALALAEAAMPFTGVIPGADAETVARLERFAQAQGSAFFHAVRASFWTVEAWTLPTRARPFSSLSAAARMSVLESWSRARPRALRWFLRAVLTPLKAAHFEHPSVFDRVGCRRDHDTPERLEPARWTQQVQRGREIDEDLELECEVVVVGTGAGGAAVAYELARRGRAVLMLEAGDYHRRDAFSGRASDAYRKMYLGRGTTVAIGNVAAPVWAGRAVGGTTVINSGTCYRAPEWTLRRWVERYGLGELSEAALSPYYERVEGMLEVAEAPAEHLGGPARVIARGATLMGLSHHPLRRNAPGCDGQGVCCFGCPVGAKRSTDASYVPAALERGAQLLTGARVDRIEVKRGRARGVSGRLASGKKLSVSAEVVVAAGGALQTPLLLRRSDVARSPWVGRNLSIHPAAKVMALFGETIDMSRGIPQSYAIDEWAREGLMFEGGSTPIDVTALGVPWVGRRLMELMDRYMNLATFGLMIQDHSRGSVREGPGGLPLIFYDLSKKDQARMQRGLAILCEVFLRAGAERVMPMIRGLDEIRSERDLERLRTRPLAPGDFEVVSFHPLGTCRIGASPERGAIDTSHESFDTPGLYVTDGSAIPSSLGVNPQMTIMALALRAAEIIDQRLA